MVHIDWKRIGSLALIQCVPLVLLCGISSTESSALSINPQMQINNPLQNVGLTIVAATSPTFMNEMGQLLTPEVIAKARAFLPYSLVVENQTGRYIYSFTVIYTYPDRIAPSGTPWKYRVSPTAAGPSDRNTMLAPGGKYLITPISDFGASIDAAGKRKLSPYVDEGMERIIKLFEEKDAKERFDVSIDSIIFDDGTLIGPDTADRMAKVNAQIKGEADLLAAIRGLHGEALRTQLRHYAEVQSDNRAYSRYQNMAAKFLITVLDNRGDAAAQAAAEELSNKWFVNKSVVRRSDK